MLVSFTGAYAGLGIQVRDCSTRGLLSLRWYVLTYNCSTMRFYALMLQWIVPTFLVLCLRRRLAIEWNQMHSMLWVRPGSVASCGIPARFASPFQHDMWLYMVLGLSLVSLVLITVTQGSMH